jgi:hypothetical protein
MPRCHSAAALKTGIMLITSPQVGWRFVKGGACLRVETLPFRFISALQFPACLRLKPLLKPVLIMRWGIPDSWSVFILGIGACFVQFAPGGLESTAKKFEIADWWLGRVGLIFLEQSINRIFREKPLWVISYLHPWKYGVSPDRLPAEVRPGCNFKRAINFFLAQAFSIRGTSLHCGAY